MHSDQARDFESRLVHEVLSTLGVEKSRTMPYHPQGDPQPERFNRTLLDMLGTLEPDGKKKWSQHIGHLVHAYNCTPNEATGFSPYFLMFVREARLPVDLYFGTSSDGTQQKTYLKYVTDLRKELKAAYKLTESIAAKQNDGNKRRYDKKICFSQLLPGDRVLLRNLGLQGKHKMADCWASNPYIVESQMPNLPVLRVKLEDGKGPIKITFCLMDKEYAQIQYPIQTLSLVGEFFDGEERNDTQTSLKRKRHHRNRQMKNLEEGRSDPVIPLKESIQTRKMRTMECGMIYLSNLSGVKWMMKRQNHSVWIWILS